jgi:proteic killer suppression protein
MNDDSRLSGAYGSDLAGQIRKRLDDLAAVTVLEDMKSLPGRCEELSGYRKWQLSLRLSKNFRLIFEPSHEPVPAKVDGGFDWMQVTLVKVTEIIDNH